MMDKLQITNLDQFRRAALAYEPKLRRKLEQAVTEPGAKLLEATIKAETPVKTGQLVKSIKARRSRAGWVVGVSKKQMRKGKWLEYGTVNMPAKPFFWGPAYAAMTFVRQAMTTQAKHIIRNL